MLRALLGGGSRELGESVDRSYGRCDAAIVGSRTPSSRIDSTLARPLIVAAFHIPGGRLVAYPNLVHGKYLRSFQSDIAVNLCPPRHICPH